MPIGEREENAGEGLRKEFEASNPDRRSGTDPRSAHPFSRRGMIGATWIYFGALILLPVGVMTFETFRHGLGPVFAALSDPQARYSFYLTGMVSLFTLAINTIFGVILALTIVRQRFFGRGLLNAVVDLPFAVSPVIAGYMLLLLFGSHGWLRGPLDQLGWKIAYALPGMIIATTFVSLPFVVREVAPVLAEAGVDQEEAAATLGAGPFAVFFHVTLPNIRWGLLYGITLTLARALGEFGAALVVGGNIAMQTQTATQYVNEQYIVYNQQGAFSAAFALALISFLTLLCSELFRNKVQREMGRAH
jgi:sulfate transport system permease protein